MKRQFRIVFQSFLERHHNQESILFINKVIEYTEEYKKVVGLPFEYETFSLMLRGNNHQADIRISSASSNRRNTLKLSRRSLQNLHDKMNSIVETFLRNDGESELNIGPLQKSSLELWQQTSQKLSREEQDDACSEGSSGSSSSNSSSLSYSKPSLESLIEEFHPGYLLGSISLLILVDLSLGHFIKFSRSEELLHFLNKMGMSYTRKIGIDISKGYKVDLRFKPNDLKTPVITDDHIYFGLTLAQDTPDWKIVHEKKNLTVSTSRTSYVFNSKQMKGFKLCKLSIDLPYSLEDVWGMWTHQKNHLYFEPMFCNNLNYLNYIEPNASFHGTTCPYAVKIMTTAFDTKIPLLKKRYVETVTTCVKDSAIDLYMFVLHTADLPSGVATMPSNSLAIEGLCYYIMMRVNEKTTRFLNIMYSDFQLPLQNMTIGQVFKQRGKTMLNGLNSILHKLTDGRKNPVDTLENEDTAEAQRCVDDNMKSFPDRSWYMEWKGLQKK